MLLTFIGLRDPATGEPQSYIVGVPSRDLTDDDLAGLKATPDELVASGLYAIQSGPPPKPAPAPIHAGGDD